MANTTANERTGLAPLLTAEQVGRVLSLSPLSVRRLVKAGTLPAVRLSPRGHLRFRPADVAAVIAAAPAEPRRAVGAAEGSGAPVDAAGETFRAEAELLERRLWGDDSGTKDRYNQADLSPDEATTEAV